MIWSDELREEALQLFNDGLSAAAIARALGEGVTRNAVLSQIDRLRRQGKQVRDGRPAQGRLFVLETPKTRSRPKPPTRTGRDLAAPTPRLKADGSRFGTMDLREDTCHWPHGEVGRAGFHYCAHETEPGSSYCTYHAFRAARPADSEAA